MSAASWASKLIVRIFLSTPRCSFNLACRKWQSKLPLTWGVAKELGIRRGLSPRRCQFDWTCRYVNSIMSWQCASWSVTSSGMKRAAQQSASFKLRRVITSPLLHSIGHRDSTGDKSPSVAVWLLFETRDAAGKREFKAAVRILERARQWTSFVTLYSVSKAVAARGSEACKGY